MQMLHDVTSSFFIFPLKPSGSLANGSLTRRAVLMNLLLSTSWECDWLQYGHAGLPTNTENHQDSW